MHRTPLHAALSVCLLGLPCAARQTFALEVDPRASSGQLASAFTVELPGTAIGSHDPTDNPGGTRTLPGLFGGSGNQPVAMGVELAGETDHQGPPAGRVVLAADATLLSVEVLELELDLLGGAAAEALLSMTLSFETFRTFAPDSLYVGGFPITLPLGSQTLSQARLDQTAPGVPGALVPQPDPGHYSFALLVPAALSMEVGAAGQSFPLGPLPLVLPLVGELWIQGGSAVASLTFDLDVAQAIDDPLPGFSIEDVPLDLPTVLPPGSTANLLFSTTIGSLGVALAAGLDLRLQGSARCGFESYCASNVNSTGAVARLEVEGSTLPADRALLLRASGLPATQMAVMGVSQGELRMPLFRGSQGDLCISPPFARIDPKALVFAPDGTASLDLDFDDLPSILLLQPGSTWRFQLWYRDFNPEPTWNSTQGVAVRFCTP